MYLRASQHKANEQTELLPLWEETQSSEEPRAVSSHAAVSLGFESPVRLPLWAHFNMPAKIHLFLLSQGPALCIRTQGPRCPNKASVQQSWRWRTRTPRFQGQLLLWGQHHIIASLAWLRAVWPGQGFVALWLYLVLIWLPQFPSSVRWIWAAAPKIHSAFSSYHAPSHTAPKRCKKKHFHFAKTSKWFLTNWAGLIW